MASLYSAQAVIAAREQLTHQLEQKGGSQPTEGSPVPHYNPHHYHETVHEKCKHHNQPQTKLQHSKEGEKQGAGKEGAAGKEGVLGKEGGVGKEGALGKEGVGEGGSVTRMIGEHEEVREEMRAWSRRMQAWAKGEHKLNDKELHQHHTRLYKWMLFLQDMFTSYQGTLKTQTSLHALEQEEQHSHRLIQDPHALTSSHRPSHSGAVKLPHLFTRERMESLEARVADLEQQLEASQLANHDITRKCKELSAIVTESEERHQRQFTKLQSKQMSLMMLLGELEDFCSHLLGDLSNPDKLKNEYLKIVEQKLMRIRDERSKLEKGRI